MKTLMIFLNIMCFVSSLDASNATNPFLEIPENGHYKVVTKEDREAFLSLCCDPLITVLESPKTINPLLFLEPDAQEALKKLSHIQQVRLVVGKAFHGINAFYRALSAFFKSIPLESITELSFDLLHFSNAFYLSQYPDSKNLGLSFQRQLLWETGPLDKLMRTTPTGDHLIVAMQKLQCANDKAFKNVTSFILKNTDLKFYVGSVMPNLLTLTLIDCNIQDSEARAFLEKGNFSKLEQLTLYGNALSIDTCNRLKARFPKVSLM